MSAQHQQYKFSEIIADPRIRERWEKVRRYFFLRESTYDMSNRCNIRCEGCYYFAGEKQFAIENSDENSWRRLFQSEKERGITFAVLAGAEPSLVPHLCKICYQTIPLGAIASNGLKPISREIDYRIHISVWGNDRTSETIRKAPNMLARQIANYKDDPRAVFVYTFTPENIDEARQVTKLLTDNGRQITFNMFSAPVGYQGHLRHTSETLKKTREVMSELLRDYPQTVLFSTYNIVAHTEKSALHELFSCSYPRMNSSMDVGLGRTFRQYRTDLQWDREAACCVPDTDCDDCRHYAAGSALVTARMYRHAIDPVTFSAWLDYVDTYLAVWVRGYDKGVNLCNTFITPPPKN
ncbi:radical SAM protein [Desulfopila inferna]|uniref:radical SAM protein n=1 Tax=Desulfopila inferna TaxID=468528 RepID=UPI0019643F8B|nr:radical SAM protein [Desulfopila inferna]MBM9604296.1 radical SAM protein [Desulfopila inferna]